MHPRDGGLLQIRASKLSGNRCVSTLNVSEALAPHSRLPINASSWVEGLFAVKYRALGKSLSISLCTGIVGTSDSIHLINFYYLILIRFIILRSIKMRVTTSICVILLKISDVNILD